MALASRGHADATGVLVAGLGYGAVLYGTNILHSLGHIVAGRVVGSPVEAVLMTSTRDVMIYAQPGATAPARRRLGRALGGPIANLAAGSALILAGHWARVPWVAMSGIVNVGVALWTLVPVPSLDGWVIWRIVVRSARDEAA